MLSEAKWQVGLDLLPSLLFLFFVSFRHLGVILTDFRVVLQLKNQGTVTPGDLDCASVSPFVKLLFTLCLSSWIAEDTGETLVICDSVLSLVQIHVQTLMIASVSDY